MPVLRAAPPAIALGFLAACLAFGTPSRADVIPQQVELPLQLSLDQSVQILKSRSLDLLISEASIRNAEGDVGVAGAVPNPALTLGYGRTLGGYPTDGTCPPGGPGSATGCSRTSGPSASTTRRPSRTRSPASATCVFVSRTAPSPRPACPATTPCAPSSSR